MLVWYSSTEVVLAARFLCQRLYWCRYCRLFSSLVHCTCCTLHESQSQISASSVLYLRALFAIARHSGDLQHRTLASFFLFCLLIFVMNVLNSICYLRCVCACMRVCCTEWYLLSGVFAEFVAFPCCRTGPCCSADCCW